LYDKRVRQAFAMAIDKQAITDQVLKGLAIPTNAFSGDPKVTEKVTGLPYDVEKAKQLLADAGFPNGQGLPELTFFAPPANDPQMPVIEAVAKMWQDNLGAKIRIQNNEGPVYSTLQWANYNEDVPPGYSTLGGPMNWFQPLDLMLNSGHTFWFMDFKPGGVAKFAEFDDQLAEVTNLTAPGDFAALTQRADAAWTKRQQIISQENNAWGESMQLEPTFMDQWEGIAKRFNEAADDAAKLSAYQDALTLVLNEERAQAQYDFMTDENREAHRQMALLSTKTLEDAWDVVVPLQQLTVDAAWMVPIYNDKVFYVTAPQLSGIVLNKLSWGGTFQYQYLNWEE
jgi:peptide/nickel transport system substrate-binding protein